MKRIFHFSLLFGLAWLSISASSITWADNVSLPTEASLKALQTQIDKISDSDKKNLALADIEASLDLLKQITAQQKMNQNLNALLANAESEIQRNTTSLQNLKQQDEQNYSPLYAKQDLSQLQETLAKLIGEQQATQEEVNAANNLASSQATVSERAQIALTDNLRRTQEINKLITENPNSNTLLQRYNLELELINLKNRYNQTLLKNSDQLVVLYQSRYSLYNARAQLQQQQLTQLQEVINQKNLQQSQEKVEQAQTQQQNVGKVIDIIQKELDRNTQLTQYLLQQTEKTNQLTQDELRMRSVLDSLTQTQRNIDEQISALQGTLVLSRIIQQQKQRLPANFNIQGLPKQIADLRVQIFDITQRRNELYDLETAINKLAQESQRTFSDNEKTQLETLLTARRKVASDLINSLNNQLNLAITLELTQQQISQISDQLQSKLEQQSFWVKSNNPINLDWLKTFPVSFSTQMGKILKKLSFQTNFDDFPPLLSAVGLLVFIGGLIRYFKARIKQNLTEINNKINHVHLDSQWNTPIALFYTAILCLSSTLWFLAGCLFIGFFCFRNPEDMWQWGWQMSGFWWLFSFILSSFRPNGICVRHFGFSTDIVADFHSVTKRIAISTILLLNTSIFSHVVDNGLINDVMGEMITIASLIFFLFITLPRFKGAIRLYASSSEGQNRHRTLNFIVLVLLQTVPVALIILVLLGYYYTALTLIEHIIRTYIAWVAWSFIRHTVYRSITVSARRLTYRRLLEKRQQKQQRQDSQSNNNASDDVVVLTEQEEGMAIGEVRNQLVSFADLFLWAMLLGLLYFVWSDLLTVANYLRNIPLWQQLLTTDAGTVAETITLFNLIVALVILTITYILVRNISGILEVSVFSKIKLSQGTPYTINTLLTYAIIAIGGIWAFATLGISWSKLQWLVSALLVGLGFGLQEIFANFVSGLILLFERPIRVGDTVTINGITGTIAKIRIRATTIIDSNCKEVIIPNKSLVTGQVTNWALSNTVTRLVLTIGVAYGSDLELVRKLLLQAAAEEPNVLKDPAPRALFLSFGASTLDHELRVYVGKISARTATIDSLNRKIDLLFAQHNVEMAFNQLDVFIKNQDNGAVMPLVENKATV